MTESADKNADRRIRGDALISQIRDGWAPLPTRTLFTLAMGGLRVRMMRSAVTMLSIVLAIAFLTYTGINSKLTYNLADGVRQREKEVAQSNTDVTRVIVTLKAFDPFAAMSVDDQKAVARKLRIDDVDRRKTELPTHRQQARNAKLSLDEVETSHLTVMNDPEASAADHAESKAKLQSTRETYAQRQATYLHERDAVELGLWLHGEATEELADPQQKLTDLLRETYAELIGLMSTPSRYDSQQLKDLDLMFTIAGDAGQAQAVTQMRAALDQEMAKRATSDLKTKLRHAGVSVEATLAGNPMDMWLIIMAMLTCAVGIANAMLMSVTERFREIGTMKCLGAQDGLVVKLFLMESGVLGVVGAMFGIVVGIIVALLAAVLQFAGYGLTYFPILDALDVIVLSILGGIILAVVGAVYPAFAASRMQPIDALRVDE